MSIKEILEQVKELPQEEQRELYEALETILKKNTKKEKKYRIWEFEGIAAHLADDEDPQDYVNRLRDEWDKEV